MSRWLLNIMIIIGSSSCCLLPASFIHLPIMKNPNRYYPAKWPEKVKFATFLHIQQTGNEQFIHSNFNQYFEQLVLIESRRRYFPSHVPVHLLPYNFSSHLFGAAFLLINGKQAYDRAFALFKSRYGAELRKLNGGTQFLHRLPLFLQMYSLHPMPCAAYHLYVFSYGAIGKSVPLFCRKSGVFMNVYSSRNVYDLSPIALHYLSIFYALLHEYQNKIL